MSEALALPPDMPVEGLLDRKPINIRKAMAGVYILQGRGSVYRCCVEAGFSRSTSRALQRNGLNAEQCIEEAAKLDPSLAPAKLLEGGRRVLAESIAFRDPRRMAVKDAVKLFEVTEKYFGGHALQPVNAITGLSDRLSGIVAVLLVARERGLPVPELPPSFIDAEVVATASANEPIREHAHVSEHVTVEDKAR